MMRRPLRASLALALLAVSASPLFAQLSIDTTVEIPAARTAAIGGVHVALADDLSSLFSNPAGFVQAGPEMRLAELTVGLSGPVFRLADFILQAVGSGNPAALISSGAAQDLFQNLYTSGSLNGPLAIGYVGNGLGFGIFNTSRVTFTTVNALLPVSAEVKEDLLFAAGFAFSIPLPEAARSTLDIGLMIKSFVEGGVELSESLLDLYSVIASANPGVLINQPFSLGLGAGLDAGIRYSWNGLISVGLVGRNIPTFTARNTYSSIVSLGQSAPVTGFGYVPVDLSAGLMFTPGLGFLDRYITHLKIFLDYSDILDFWLHPDTAANWVLHVGLGTELTILEILSLRGGFADGYFSAGLGMDLSFFRLDVAMFGQELSLEPGLRPAFNVLFGIAFKI
jgi:hypothetical protein